MLMAHNSKGDLVSALEIGDVRDDTYSCPGCRGSLVLRRGKVMCPHFAHKSLGDCHFFSENESEQHLRLKALLYEGLSNHGQEVQIERIFPDLGQIADVFVGDHLALEVQCSRLPQDRLRERTQSYQEAGIEVRWLLGRELWLKERLSHLQRDFLYFTAQIGFHLWELDLEARKIRLKYLIYEDIFGRVYHLTRSWSLDSDFLDILRFPYRRLRPMSYQVKLRKRVAYWIQRELMGKNPRWMRYQEEAYRQGQNLLTMSDEDFYPQVRFPRSEQGFCQIQTPLEIYRRLFNSYYQKARYSYSQTLYPPHFYAKIEGKVSKRRK